MPVPYLRPSDFSPSGLEEANREHRNKLLSMSQEHQTGLRGGLDVNNLRVPTADPNGLPIGTTGGLLPEQASEAVARLERMAFMPAPGAREDLVDGNAPAPRYDAVGGTGGARAAAPLRSPTQPTLNPGNMPDPMRPGSLADLRVPDAGMDGQSRGLLASIIGGQPAGTPNSMATMPKDLRLPGPVAAGMAVRDLRAGYAGRDEQAALIRAGAQPNADDPPEVRASKLRYLEMRVGQSAAGQELRAPGTPTYTGAAPAAAPVLGARELALIGDQMVHTANNPRVVNMGKDSSGRPIEGTVDRNGNFSRITPEKPNTLTVAGKTYTVGPGGKYFDEQGKPVDFRDDEKPFTVNDWLIMGKAPEEYEAYRTNFQKMKGGAGEPTKSDAPAPAAGAAKPIASKAEFDALKAGEKFVWNGRTGTKK